jgi:hypothetical protein
MKHLLIIPCLLLCSCPFEEEAEPENTTLSSPSSVVPSSSSVEPEPSILDCPPEDIAEYPVLEVLPPLPDDDPKIYGCGNEPPPKFSVEELSFGKQGGVRCVATSNFMSLLRNNEAGCYREDIFLFPDGSTLIGQDVNAVNKRFKKLVCPWFTATAVDIDDWPEGPWYTIHISVNQNETGDKRENFVGAFRPNCVSYFKIIQSPN